MLTESSKLEHSNFTSNEDSAKVNDSLFKVNFYQETLHKYFEFDYISIVI